MVKPLHRPAAVHLQVEIGAGASIGEAADDMCRIAQILAVTVTADFNEVMLVATPQTATDALIDDYFRVLRARQDAAREAAEQEKLRKLQGDFCCKKPDDCKWGGVGPCEWYRQHGATA